MKYIVKSIVDTILKNAPDKNGEMMLRVDGFEDLKIYVEVCREITEKLSSQGVTVEIKLAKNKWKQFQKTADTTAIQVMEQQKWIAETESITSYRNSHNYNILILLGTEEEEDRSGLTNCYTITPEGIAREVGKNYYDIFAGHINFSDEEAKCVDKLCSDLFEFIPLDICKLSDLFDEWAKQIDIVDDFIRLFYKNLPQWGLPYKELEIPSEKEVRKKANIFRTPYNFISRQSFKKLNKNQYKKYETKIDKYNDDSEGEYTSKWHGWNKQGIKSYEELKAILLGYIRGEHVEEYHDKLLKTDFSIIEKILDFKIITPKPIRTSIPTVTGNPLEAFTNALLQTLVTIKEMDIPAATLEFQISQAEVINMFSDVESDEEKQQLFNTWRNICIHIGGVFNYIDRYTWYLGEEELKLQHNPSDVFSLKAVLKNIESGIIKAAGPNKSINKIDFCINCKDKNGTILKTGRKDCSYSYQWKFSSSESWLHDFPDICEVISQSSTNSKYIPIATMKNLKNLLFSKSEEEFFDFYEENDINFEFNLVDYINKHVSVETQHIAPYFEKLGEKFYDFIKEISEEGFYTSVLKSDSKLVQLVKEYTELGKVLSHESLPENQKWLLEAFIHAFNIEHNSKVIIDDTNSEYCIVPAWHPAALEKLNDQKIFFMDGCYQWWEEQRELDIVKKDINTLIDTLSQMSLIQSAVDIFPSHSQQLFGATGSFGNFSIYARKDIRNTNRLKDMIHKDAIFDDDFDNKENTRMNDNAKMIYGVLSDYMKAFPNAYSNMSIVFIDPVELQPIIAAIYKFIDTTKKINSNLQINLNLKILVKPDNKGGRNYLAYWMDECFSEDTNVNIKTYMNEWEDKNDIDTLLNGNNDIVFVMDLLKVNNLSFIQEDKTEKFELTACRFPIVFKPSPVSSTMSNKRRIELSQPQFRASYAHTQVVHYLRASESIPDRNFIAVREVCIDEAAQDLVRLLHQKSYWVVCIDSGMDGALLRNDKDYYPVIGFSTGKGVYGQYNLTITARESIVESIKEKLRIRLQQLFHWDEQQIIEATEICQKEASYLDGVSLFSAMNQKDYNIHEFMAYVLTSLRERELAAKSALKIIIHLDSYKHWFDDTDAQGKSNNSRPDFLILELDSNDNSKLEIQATVTECKMSRYLSSEQHKEKAIGQVKHGIERLSKIFAPNSISDTKKSIKRRYWYAQLYRALTFAQITFRDDSSEFSQLSSKLRAVLEGDFDIKWKGQVLGYWLDMDGDIENLVDVEGISLFDIPQKRIQQLLLSESITDISYVAIDEQMFIEEEEEEDRIQRRENELKKELEESKKIQRYVEPKPVAPSNPIEPIKSEEQKVESKDMDENNIAENELPSKEITKTSEEIDIKTKKVSLEETRVLIGTDKLSNPVYWEFGNKQLSNRHLLITGTSGQGKTYSIQTMLYELSKSNISSVIFDYTEGFRTDQLEKEFVSRMGEHINQRLVKFQKVPINPFKRQFIEFAGMYYPENDADVAGRFANIMTHVYNFGEQQAAAIFEAVRIGLSKYKDQMSMSFFQKELENVQSTNKSAQTVISKMKPFFYSIEFEEDGSFDWKDVIYPEESTATIFQLTAIDRDMQVIITELMLWDLWYYTTKNGNKNKPFVVVLDEAQNLSHKEKSPSCKILTEGRKFGWSAWYATQSLNVLSNDEVTRLMQSAFKLYFKPTDDEITKMSKQLDPTDGTKWLGALTGLQKGKCIVVGERLRHDNTFGSTKPSITSVTSFENRS